jgi:O-methyltransferase involved in polyketide biosynthesis
MTEKLVQAGYQPDEPTAFTVEGLTIYLTEEDVAELFSRLADLGTTGSRLAVSFESGFERQRVLRLLTRAYYGRVGETLRCRLRPGDAAAVFSEAGWTIDALLAGSDLDKEHLSKTKLAGTLDTSSFVVVAQKQIPPATRGCPPAAR